MRRSLAVLGLLLVAGCSTEPRSTKYILGPPVTFGEAVQHNMAAHIIDPTPTDPRVEPRADGQRARLGIRRYRTDEVEPPATTTVSGIGAVAVGGGSAE